MAAGGRGPRAGVRPLVASVLLLVLLSLAGSPASAVPTPVLDLRVDAVEFQTINVTFNVSASADVDRYVIYVSNVSAPTVAGLVASFAADGTRMAQTRYDEIHVTSPENASRMQPGTFDPNRFRFDNGTAGNWTLGRVDVFVKYVPSDTRRILYSITGLLALATHHVAVTPVDSRGEENGNITTVSAVPLAAPVERLPGNEGILLTFGGIILALVVAFLALWKTSGHASRPAYAYVGPAIIALAALTFYPTAVGFFLSFTDRTLTSGHGGFDFNLIGLDNYVRVFQRPEFTLVAATTIVWTLVNVFFHVTMGLVLAVLLNRKIRGRPIYRTLFLLPWAVPSYISIIAWRGMFDRGGVIDALFGGSIDWLGSMPWALVAVIAANVWLGIPFMMMVFSGGLQGIPEDLYEAADVDGLTRWQKFRRITLPLLKPTIVPASLLGFIWTFNLFNVIYLMTQGRPTVAVNLDAGATDILITYVYREGFQPFWRQGFAAAYSVVIFFMLLVLSLSYTRYTRAMESFAGERAPRKKGRLARALDRLVAPLSARLWLPVKRALDPGQPEAVHAGWLPFSAGAIGLFELAYGWSVLTGMGKWNTATAVHGITFGFLGLLGASTALLLAAGRASGRRIGVWTALIGMFAGVLAALWAPWPLGLRPFWYLALLVALALPMPAPEAGPSGLARMAQRLDDAWARLRQRLPQGRGGSILERSLLHVFLILFAIFSVFPVLMVVGTAFSNFNAMTAANLPLIGPYFSRGTAPTWGFAAFVSVTTERPFLTWLGNSLLVSAGTTLWGLAVVLPAAYGFSRFDFRGKRWMMLSFLIVQMFPGAIILIPYYAMMQQLRLLDNPLGLILAYSVTALPFMVWMLKGFFDTIPRDLEEAAMVDGTTRTGAFVRVILPLSLPALAVTALFSFLSAWNEWLLAFTFMSKERNFTLPVGISSLVQPPNVFWNEYSALSLIVSIPVVVLFIVFQKYLISGLTKGAVKG